MAGRFYLASSTSGATVPAVVLLVGLHEPEPLVDTARDLGKDIGSVGVAQLIELLNPLPTHAAEGRESSGECLHMLLAAADLHRVLAERRAFGGAPSRAFRHSSK